MCRTPVTFGGGITMTIGLLAGPSGGLEQSLRQPGFVDAVFEALGIVGFLKLDRFHRGILRRAELYRIASRDGMAQSRERGAGLSRMGIGLPVAVRSLSGLTSRSSLDHLDLAS